MELLKYLWKKWKSVAEVIGNFQMTVIFSILYFLIFVPAGIFVNLTNDFLNIKGQPRWLDMETNSKNLEELKEQ